MEYKPKIRVRTFLGMSEEESRFIQAIEDGEINGDIVEDDEDDGEGEKKSVFQKQGESVSIAANAVIDAAIKRDRL